MVRDEPCLKHSQDTIKRAPVPDGPIAPPSQAELIAAALEPMIERAVQRAVERALGKGKR